MAKYQIKYIFSDGEELIEDELFDSEAEATEAGEYGCGCYSSGMEILNMSNPGDYPLEEDDHADFEIIEMDD